MTVFMERGCFERGCACYDDRVDKDYVEVDEVRKYIDPKGSITMLKEEHDDMIATLEQENRQLRARNDRLEKEKCTPLNGDQVRKMWQSCGGEVMRFVAMIESFHGIGGMDASR